MRSGKSEEAAITRRINRNERLCGASITENGPTDLHWIGPKANHLFLVAAPRRPSSPSADPLNWKDRLANSFPLGAPSARREMRPIRFSLTVSF
ncbi:Hypothetical protein NTJ_10173 [Nesidiocoris tenuis]|uniref:Uncharacterized protein n=1 Tax=Nesidiocoris tenuis TaxID=355587 RepID=A0ABN7AYW8_9HEMI|nr:Hypothetical protein NTJ_10173 [Nesidiocoris tenuis]